MTSITITVRLDAPEIVAALGRIADALVNRQAGAAPEAAPDAATVSSHPEPVGSEAPRESDAAVTARVAPSATGAGSLRPPPPPVKRGMSIFTEEADAIIRRDWPAGFAARRVANTLSTVLKRPITPQQVASRASHIGASRPAGYLSKIAAERSVTAPPPGPKRRQ